MHIVAYIIDSCNYNCSYCYNKKPRTRQNIDLSSLYSMHMQMLKKFKNIKCELIGGEPTLHPDLLEFCQKTKEFPSISLLIYSNGSKDVAYIAKLLRCGVDMALTLHYSMDSDSLLQKVIALSNAGFSKQIQLRIMLEHGYEHQSFSLYDKAKHICSQCDVRLCLIDDTIKSYSQEFHEKIQKSSLLTENTFISRSNSIYEFVSFDSLYIDPDVIDSMSFRNWVCNAGYNYIYVHSNGNIYQCQTYFENRQDYMCNISNFSNSIFKKHICKMKNCSNCEICIDKQKVF